MSAMTSQVNNLTSVYSSVYSRRRSNKTSKLRVTGLCVGNSPLTGEFPAQRATNAENVSIWWRHHVIEICLKWEKMVIISNIRTRHRNNFEFRWAKYYLKLCTKNIHCLIHKLFFMNSTHSLAMYISYIYIYIYIHIVLSDTFSHFENSIACRHLHSAEIIKRIVSHFVQLLLSIRIFCVSYMFPGRQKDLRHGACGLSQALPFFAEQILL